MTRKIKAPPLLISLQGAAENILMVARIYGFTKPYDSKHLGSEWYKLVKDYDKSSGNGPTTYMKFLKNKIASYYAAHKQQKLPTFIIPGDKPHILATGTLYRFMKDITDLHPINLCGFPTAEALRESFLTSILYAKKGTPRPGKEDLIAGEISTFKDLTTSKGDVTYKEDDLWFRRTTDHLLLLGREWGSISEDEPMVEMTPKVGPYLTVADTTKEAIMAQIRRTVREVFGSVESRRYTMLDRTKPFFPSTNANYNWSRNDAGAVGAILDSKLLDGLRINQTEVLGTLALNEEKLVLPLPGDISAHIASFLRPEERLKLATAYNINTFALDTRFQIFWERLQKAALLESPRAEPLGLPEPLKVRVITKGPPLLYTLLKPLQRKMLSVQRKHPIFGFIGSVINEVSLAERLGNRLKEDEWFYSLDYQNATNEIVSWASETSAKEVNDILGLTQEESECHIRSLTGHTITLKNETQQTRPNGEPQELPQKGGQLMGSITSFNHLCFITAAMARYSKEKSEGRVYTLKDCHGAINGDDGLIKGNKHFYNVWKVIAAVVGLHESVGKTYISREFCNMNSTSFLYKPGRRLTIHGINREVAFEEVQYVNTGLIKGLIRSGTDHDSNMDNKLATIGARSRELLRMTPIGLRARVFKYFKKYNEFTYKLPWFIPEWLGGYGVPLEFATKTTYPKTLDLKIAQMMLFNWKQDRFRPKKVSMEGGWQTRHIAQGLCPKPTYVDSTDADRERKVIAYDQLLSIVGIELLFQDGMTLDRLLITTTEVNKRALRHNEKIWTRKYGTLPQPLALDRLAYLKKYEGLDLEVRSLLSEERTEQFYQSLDKWINAFPSDPGSLPSEDELWT